MSERVVIELHHGESVTRIEPARCAVHEHEWAHCCRACEGDRKAGGDVADTLALSATQAETNERGLALTRAALTEPKETP